MTHTKGPWRAELADEKIYGADNEVVVYELSTNEDDAHLIAAAPELLEAAKAALFVLNIVHQREPGTNEAGAIAELDAAISKAEGRS